MNDEPRSERRRGSDRAIDTISEKIGRMSGKVDRLAETMTTLTDTVARTHEETTQYRADIGAWRKGISETVGGHEDIAAQINADHLPELNGNLEYIRGLRAKAEFWAGLRARIVGNVVEKSVWALLLITSAAILYTFAPDVARKIIEMAK